MAFTGLSAASDSRAKALAAVTRALALDGRLSSAHATLAWMQLNFDHDWAASAQSFARALELDPNDARARFRYAHLLTVRGQLGEASREALAAGQIDPLAAEIPNFLAFLAWYGDDTERALAYMRQSADLAASTARFGAFAAFVDAARGDCAAARTELAQLRALADEMPRTTETAYALGHCGDAPAAVEAFREDLIARRLPYPTAMVHFGRGELGEFFRWLDMAIDAQSPEVVWLGVEPLYRPLHGDSRFRAALQRVHLELPAR